MSKTKGMLVEVARQLFAQKGVVETTMNDIATASGKGRRTLYTYFRSILFQIQRYVGVENNDFMV